MSGERGPRAMVRVVICGLGNPEVLTEGETALAIFAAWKVHNDTKVRSVIPRLALVVFMYDGETASLSLAQYQVIKLIVSMLFQSSCVIKSQL